MYQRQLQFLSSLIVFFLLIGTIDAQTRYWVAGAGANWSGDNWSSASGAAADGGGPPTALQSAQFDANGLGNCTVDVLDPSIAGLVVNGYTGIIDINGNTVTSSGTVTLTSGTINDTPGTDSLVINSTVTTTFNGTTFGAIVFATSDDIILSGSTFNAQSSFEKNGTGNNTGTGGNTFNGPTFITHSSANNLTLANVNPDDFNDDLTIISSGSGRVQMSHVGSGNTYDGNIELNSTGTSTGIYFGNGGGTSTLATGFTFTIGASGFSIGTLIIRNFTQSGATAQSLALTGTAVLTIYDDDWGGNVTFSAPRFTTRGTTYQGTASLTKNGTTNDASVGGNRFTGDVTLAITSSGYFLMGNTSPDTFDLDVTLTNTGTNHLYLANGSANNIVSGNLTATNNATGAGNYIYIGNNGAASLAISGDVTLTNSATASDSRIYLGNTADVTVGGNITATNSATGAAGYIYIANADGSVVDITGNVSLTNGAAGTTKRIYLGSAGDVNVTGTLSITNNSTATNSQVYCNNSASSDNTYGNNITIVSSTASTDGVLFGNGGGESTLAATRTISIGGGGFIAGALYLRNFTQIGATAQALAPTSATTMTVYDSDWGGDVTFSSPRFFTRGTTYGGTSSLTKNGASNDGSVGGNRFNGNATITNSGSGTVTMANTNPDTFDLDLSIVNSGTSSFTLSNSANNVITGNLTTTNSATGGTNDLIISSGAASTMTIGGNVIMNNSGSATNTRSFFGNNGDITLTGDLTLTGTASGSQGHMYIASGTDSQVSIGGNTIVSNSGGNTTKRVYLGNNGDVTFTGTLDITNSSSATNSQIYCNYQANSVNAYNGNITLEVTDASSDGILFGGNGGFGTLAATRTISIGGGGFIGRLLTLRNFTQVGATAQSLSPTGTVTNITIYDSNWGGDVTFSAAQITTRGTTYSGTTSLSKTGATNNTSIGGNTFNGVTTINNSGSGDILMASTIADAFNDALTINNTGSRYIYMANTVAGNMFNGNIVLNSTGSSLGIYFGNGGGSSTLAATRTITLGGSGFSAGQLYLRNFTQTGATAQALALTGAGRMTIYDSNWGGDVVFSSPRITTRGTTYSGTASLTKNGGTDDTSVGGNTFTGNASLFMTSTGEFRMGNGSPDTFSADLDISNSGSDAFYLGQNSAGNTVGGNLTISNTSTGTAYIYISSGAASTLTVTGTTDLTNAGTGDDSRIIFGDAGDVTLNSSLTITNSSSATTGQVQVANGAASTVMVSGNVIATNSGSGASATRIYLGNTGDITFGGDLSIINSATATTGEIFVADDDGSVVSISGATTLTHSGAGTNTRAYLGNQGDVTFDGTLAITNSSGSNNSQVYCNNNVNSANTYNQNITLEVTNAASDGILFGGSNGSGTLAATRTISIGGGGFIAGALTLRNFTQIGATAQTLITTGTAIMTIYDSNWGGDIIFSAPRITTRGTTYSGTSSISKTGASDDTSVGGNTFTGNATLNNSGSGYIRMGNGSSDTYSADLDIDNTGSRHIYMAYNSAGNTVGGNLTATNTGTGTSYIYLSDAAASTLTVTGNTTLLNNGTGVDCRIYLGNTGDATLNGDLDITSSASGSAAYIYVANANGSVVTIAGNTTLSQSGSGATRRSYLGNDGDITFTGTLSITNSSDATNSQIYCNEDGTSNNTYNNNIILEVTDASCDGIFFGRDDGSGTLAATRTITIGGGGYVAGALTLRNFTQVGATAQALAPTGTTIMTVYDSDWGGDVVFSSPQMFSRGTTYSGTASLEKTGAVNNISVGGNTFTGNATLTNSGSGYFRFGSGTMDAFNADVDLINSGSNDLYFAYSGAGHSVAGNLTATNSGSGSSDIFVSDASSATLTVTGTATFTNSGSGSDVRIYIGDAGDITFSSDLTIANTASGTAGTVYLGDDASSTISIAGNTAVTNSGSNTTRRVYLGNNGDVTFTGTLTIDNSSSAVNSQVYCNNAANSVNEYSNNIIITNSNASGDGVLFGNGGGSSTLAATRTITIGGAGFVAGSLTLRNFTQTGATAQALAPTGTTLLTIYDSNWGGDVVFSSPRILSRGTTYSGTASLEKTGATDDRSQGGNTFVGDATLTNSGSGYWRFGEGTLDAFNANVDIVNSGSRHFYFAYSGAGHSVAGELTSTNSGTGTSYVYIGSASSSTLTVTGNAIFTNSGSGTDVRTYLGDAGDITFNGDVTTTNSASGNQGLIYFASNAASVVTIAGNTTVSNSGANTTKRYFIGNQGDVTFTGTLDITNTSTATNSQVYLNYNSNSDNTYNNNITLECTDASSDGILFGANNGDGTLAATRTVTITGGGFIGQNLFFRNFTQTGATAQTLAPTGSAILTVYDCNWGGNVTFSASRITTRGTTYSGTASLEKTGSGNDNSVGGNVFNDDVTFTNSGTSNFLHANTVADDYNGDVTYIKTSTGNLLPAYNTTCTYSGDINLNLNTTARFASNGNGRVEFDGTGPQSINDIAATALPEFRRITLNNANDEVTLNTPIIVMNDITFTAGNLITTDANLVTVNDNSTATGASDDSYVRGPIEKIGNDAYTFPVGDSGRYRSISISAPSSGSARFRASYFEVDPHSAGYLRSSIGAGIDHVSLEEYWILDRTSSTNSVSVTMSWNTNSGGVDNLGELRVARWDAVGMQWEEHGNGGTTGNTTAGTIVSSSTISSFSPFTLASSSSNNPLPITLISYEAEKFNQEVKLIWKTSSEINNDYFTIERSIDGENFEEVDIVKGAGNSNAPLTYVSYDNDPHLGTAYYRLKQTDFDGSSSYEGIVSVSFDVIRQNSYNIYPNPVVGGRVNLEWDSDRAINQLIVLYDLQGKIVFEQAISSNEGFNRRSFEIGPSVPSGTYLMGIFEEGNLTQKKKLIIQ